MKFIEKGMLETPGLPMEREDKRRDAESPWQSELEVTIRWTVFIHLDLYFFSLGRVTLVIQQNGLDSLRRKQHKGM